MRIEARFERRGRRVLALASVVVCDPFGLCTREVVARPSPRDDEILVLPRLEPVTSTTAGGDATRIARDARKLMGAEVELDGIRPLRDGTPASRIYWPALARGAEPQERYLAADGASQPLVVLDPRGPRRRRTSMPRFARPRRSARARDVGRLGVLLPGDRRPTELTGSLHGWSHVHARLALIGPSAALSLVSIAQRRGPIVFISARRRQALPAALATVHGAARVLVVPGALADRHAAFAVAGCSGYVVGARRPRTLQRAPVRGPA